MVCPPALLHADTCHLAYANHTADAFFNGNAAASELGGSDRSWHLQALQNGFDILLICPGNLSVVGRGTFNDASVNLQGADFDSVNHHCFWSGLCLGTILCAVMVVKKLLGFESSSLSGKGDTCSDKRIDSQFSTTAIHLTSGPLLCWAARRVGDRRMSRVSRRWRLTLGYCSYYTGICRWWRTFGVQLRQFFDDLLLAARTTTWSSFYAPKTPPIIERRLGSLIRGGGLDDAQLLAGLKS